MFVLYSEYEAFSSKDRNKLLEKFVEVRLISYFQNNKLDSYFKPSESSYYELQKALNGEKYDVNLIDFDDLFDTFDEYKLIEVIDLDN